MQRSKESIPLRSLSQRTGDLVYLWIAHYSDGTSLPQYDPYTLETHIFKEVDQSKLIKFGLYPFPSGLAKRLREEKGLNVRSNIFLPKYEVDIDKDKRVIGALTTNFIEQKSFSTCPQCKQTFPAKMGKYKDMGGNVKTGVCPLCGAVGYWTCSKCGTKYNTLSDAGGYICSVCGLRHKPVRILFSTHSIQERWKIYKLGYQQTINGINKKVLMHIQENGDVELKDN